MARSQLSAISNRVGVFAVVFCAALPAFAALGEKKPRLPQFPAPASRAVQARAPIALLPTPDPVKAERRVATAHGEPQAGVDTMTTAAIRPNIPPFSDIHPQPYLGPELAQADVPIGGIEPVLATKVWTPALAVLAPNRIEPVGAPAQSGQERDRSAGPAERRVSTPAAGGSRAKPVPARKAVAQKRPAPSKRAAPPKKREAAQKLEATRAIAPAQKPKAPKRSPTPEAAEPSEAGATEQGKRTTSNLDAPKPIWFGR